MKLTIYFDDLPKIGSSLKKIRRYRKRVHRFVEDVMNSVLVGEWDEKRTPRPVRGAFLYVKKETLTADWEKEFG